MKQRHQRGGYLRKSARMDKKNPLDEYEGLEEVLITARERFDDYSMAVAVATAKKTYETVRQSFINIVSPFGPNPFVEYLDREIAKAQRYLDGVKQALELDQATYHREDEKEDEQSQA